VAERFKAAVLKFASATPFGVYLSDFVRFSCDRAYESSSGAPLNPSARRHELRAAVEAFEEVGLELLLRCAPHDLADRLKKLRK
jgi:hypothetical protein